jgi:hypothetical protein
MELPMPRELTPEERMVADRLVREALGGMGAIDYSRLDYTQPYTDPQEQLRLVKQDEEGSRVRHNIQGESC